MPCGCNAGVVHTGFAARGGFKASTGSADERVEVKGRSGVQFRSRISTAVGFASLTAMLVLSSPGVHADRVVVEAQDVAVCRAPREAGPAPSLEALLSRLRRQQVTYASRSSSSGTSRGVHVLDNRGYNYAPTPMATLSPTATR